MEFSWQRNVWEYGLANTGATVAARILAGPQTGRIATNELHGFVLLRTWGLPNMADDAYDLGALTTVSTANFPKGESVEANIPL